MQYNELKEQNYLPDNINRKFFTNEMITGKNMFRISIQLAKCQNMQAADSFVDSFVNNYKNSAFWINKDDSVRQPIGAVLMSYFCDFEKFMQMGNELAGMLRLAESYGFKGHNAKNLSLKIFVKNNNINIKTKKKLDLFVNLHPVFFRTIARRTHIDHIIYSIDKDYNSFGVSDSNRNPILFSEYPDTICFKMFRSTTNINTILSTVQLCNLLIHFCENQITIDELIENDSDVENKFNDYIFGKSNYLKHYMNNLKLKMHKQNSYLGQQGLNNNLRDCSDINLCDNDRYQQDDNQWVFHKLQEPILTVYRSNNDRINCDIEIDGNREDSDVVNYLMNVGTIANTRDIPTYVTEYDLNILNDLFSNNIVEE